MAIEVVSRPEKTLANGYLSRWNASKTPLIYKLSSDRFPTNNLDPISTITEYSYSLSEGGIVIADPSANNFIGVSFVKISGTQFIDGIYKILRVIDAGSFVIDGFTNESEGGGGQTAGNAQAYYKGYKGLVKVFVGSPEYHPYNANGTKPQIEIGTIDVDFNSDNIGVCNVRSYVKPDLMAKFSDLQNNPNLWTSFSIEYAEIWEGSGEAVYEQDLIDGCNPFSGLINTDFDEGLDDWDQVAPSGSGTFGQWTTGGPVIPYYLDLSGVNQDLLEIQQTEKVYQVPSTGTYEFGIRLRVPTSTAGGVQGLIGYNAANGGGTIGSSRWGLYITSDGNTLRFTGKGFSGGTTNVNLPNFVTNYSGQIVDIKCGWYDTEIRLYINDVILATSNNDRPSDITANPNFSFKVGSYADANGETPQSFFTGEIYSFFIDDDVFEVNEGSGFPTVSNLGTVATGQTSNTGGLTYWNNNVWQPE